MFDPVLTYEAEILILTKQIRVLQAAMERSMIGITIKDRKFKAIIRQRTNVKDAVSRIAELK